MYEQTHRDTSSNRPDTSPVWLWATYIGIGLVALLFRVLDLGLFVTIDESNYWLPRSERFLEAIQTGDFAGTAIRPHPGVTTMWLGSIGVLLRRGLLESGFVDDMPYSLMLALMQLPGALVHTVGIVVGYALLRRMVPHLVATLAALLWATDPFAIAYSRVLHLDALQMTFVVVSLLAACVYWHHDRRAGFLVLSAVCGALAFLSKVPGIIAIPVVGLIAVWAAVRPLTDSPHPGRARRLGTTAATLGAWGGIFALTVVLVWPAIWADPPGVVTLLRTGIAEEAGQPHLWGNFFLGQRNDAPGWLFYPVALALRTTPLTLLGLLLLPYAWAQARNLPHARRDLIVLVIFVVLFVVAMSLSPKKFNRYLVPVAPALDVLAAAGLIWSMQRLLPDLWRHSDRVLRGAVAAIGVVAIVNAAWWHPYSLVAFNQVLGGAPAGTYAFAAGWGEGLDQAAAWLNQQPDITGVVIASTMNNSFRPYLRHGVQSVGAAGPTLPPNTGYVMIYLRDAQRGLLGPPFDQFYQERVPLHTVTLHGVEYAWIYQVPPEMTNELDVQFGTHITLRGYKIDTSMLATAGHIELTTQWQATAPLSQNYLLFAHLLNAEGQVVGQTDAPPAGPDAPTSTWMPQRVQTWPHPIPMSNLPPGDYQIAVGLYDPDTRTRLPLTSAPEHTTTDRPPGYDNAVLLPLTIR